ncbi:MAG: membrane protein insertion efficiency factor YidD [Candidatus Omnitrophota bacterium]
MRYPAEIAIRMIKLYRNILSPMKIQCCRFYPSCSEYMIEAIQKDGLLSGSFKGLKRILRCHPFSRGGYDPVR